MILTSSPGLWPTSPAQQGFGEEQTPGYWAFIHSTCQHGPGDAEDDLQPLPGEQLGDIERQGAGPLPTGSTGLTEEGHLGAQKGQGEGTAKTRHKAWTNAVLKEWDDPGL